ncbi:MAG: T9SS type A sorting domain-containing protein [Phycisphaerae bacterium]|nr:T9SS type A sorting domain-containing protein [Saprospiraceae bacterium]
MQIRLFFILSCFWATSFLLANNAPTPIPPTIVRTQDIVSCELPPPANFHVTEEGPTSVSFAWTPYDAAKHRIRTYRASDGVLLNTTIVPAGTSEATIEPLPVNTPLYSTINAICRDETHGSDSEEVESRTIIMDIIVAGYGSGTTPSCTIQVANSSCLFWANGSSTTFRIYGNGLERRFGISYSSIQHWEARIGQNGNTGQDIKFYCDVEGSQLNPECYHTGRAVLRYWPSGAPSEMTIAEFELKESSIYAETGIFKCLLLNTNYKIERLGPGPSGGRPAPPDRRTIGDRDSYGVSYGQTATASPNPFSETLDVFPDQLDAENIHLQLFNLSGQKVLNQQFPGGLEQHSLPTAGLSSGFYMLRIEADGEVQTLKVVKSE